MLSRCAVLRVLDDTRGPRADECPVCFCDYAEKGPDEADVEPTMLACGHVVCTGCVGTMHSNEQASGGACSNTRSGDARVKCPQCRASFRRPHGDGVMGLCNAV